MNKQHIFIIVLLSVIASMNAMETKVTVTNKSSYTIPKVMIKTLLVGAKKESNAIGAYKGFVSIVNLQQGETQSVDLTATKNNETKEDGSPSKWRNKNPELALAAMEYLDMAKLTVCRVRTIQPQKDNKETYASRWKRDAEDTSDVRNFVISDHTEEIYKTTKKGDKVRRMLQVIAQK